MAAALRRLPGWNGSVDKLEQLAVPLPETISRHEKQIQDAETAVRDLERAGSAAANAIRELEARLREQCLQHEVPSEDDIRNARDRRDTGWALVRLAWLEGVENKDAWTRFGARSPGPVSLAEAYEAGIAEADNLADRLRREAQNVATKAEWLAQLQKHQSALEKLSKELLAASRKRDQVRVEWESALGAAGPPSFPPAEMREWIGQRDKVLRLHADVRERQDQRDRDSRLISDYRNRLASCLSAASDVLPETLGSLSSMMDACDSLIADQGDLARKIGKLEIQIAEEQGRLDAATVELKAADADLEMWRGQWGEKMGRIGLGPEATPEQADTVLAEITKLFQLLKDADGFRSRINGIDRDEARFQDEARNLAFRVATELKERTPEEIADALWDRLRGARDASQSCKSLTEHIQAETTSLDAAQKVHATARLELEALCRDAFCASESELPAAEQRSARRVQLEADLKRCEGQIRQQSAGASVEVFAREVSQSNPDTLDLSIEGLEAELKGIQQDLQDVNQTIGSEATVLAQMDGSSEAAEVNEAVGFALAQLSEDVPRYAVLRLASKVPQRGIERYRERNQGPVLARASELFTALTRGSFERLRVETSERDESVIVGERPGGQEMLGVEAMSAGSCDQLYLAIRIAYLEHWLAGREPIPFIVDDILLSFDDDRAIAALKVLGELSRRTQVIFFTHHAHLLELARSVLSEDVLFPHFLVSGTAL
jgi:uncharacterized protein YhaN